MPCQEQCAVASAALQPASLQRMLRVQLAHIPCDTSALPVSAAFALHLGLPSLHASAFLSPPSVPGSPFWLAAMLPA